ncbi:hypothetical protein E3P92_02844 [Wallemia ichthyophaga]|uniref:Association with the SNF1 complex (ASC) domain-containing protein n=2 Tax=Wallemia ichthyophaga TaxID=245174 RepID=A0A4T0K4T6_WALIC|nr:SNF1 protein kinase subunit beta-2 [Wallemia ichthyophaga EXF-994]TIA68630.1 hypothetical protein E3P91_04006 [Wallemia ichthyophaga]EOQ99284.1 SNF1 protein kinase subunit beta-2 [Wallemia ichthyophaga EXF-994]TIA80658.1 hypothetical protein E3P98_02587 [Wallemia ichthyophaga]TIA89260.1 hypothetical protein E3P97_03096 [Wallemia ichthyophaga]TIA97934.1 hypothetical protein E3P95_02674 [Wallemia ichthyophaga]
MGNSASSSNTQRQQSIKDIATHNRQASQQQAAAYKAQQPRRNAEFPRRRSLELPDLLPFGGDLSQQPPTDISHDNSNSTHNPSITHTTRATPPPPPAWCPQPGSVSSPLIDAAVALQASYFPTVPASQPPAINLKLDDGSDLPAYNAAAVNRDDENSDELTDTVLSWRGGGNDAQVRFGPGWKTSVPMTRSEKDFVTCVKLPPGHHRIVFVVDNNWRVSDDLQTATDDDGLMVNYIEVPKLAENDRKEHTHTEINNTRIITPQSAKEGDLQCADDQDGTQHSLTHSNPSNPHTHHDPTPPHEYTTDIPQMLVTYANLESGEGDSAHNAHSSHSSHTFLPEPPMLPRQLERVVLNAQPPQIAPPANSTVPHGGTLDDNSVLPIPNHVTLRHLTASAIRGGVLAVGTTTRYRRKFISTVYYTSID